jgi:hypothetical protein
MLTLMQPRGRLNIKANYASKNSDKSKFLGDVMSNSLLYLVRVLQEINN